MTDTTTDYSVGAQMLVDGARHSGIDGAHFTAGILREDRLAGVAATLGAAVAHLQGPDLDHNHMQAGALSFVASVEATLGGHDDIVEELLPATMSDAYAQLATARRMLAELLGQPGGDDYLTSVRVAMLAPTDDDGPTDE